MRNQSACGAGGVILLYLQSFDGILHSSVDGRIF